jgi:CCR4-NOT transcription complex subunit 2
MLNGQNNYQTAPPGAGGGFPLVGSHGNMQGMQYGMGPGRPGPGGMNPGAPQARGQFMGGMQGGMQGNPGGPAGVFNAQAQMNGGLGLGGAPPGLGGSPGGARQSMDRGGSGGALLQRQGSMPGAANGGMMGPSAGAPRGMMGGGGGGSFGGGGGIPGPRGSGPDLLAMINKGGGGGGMGGFALRRRPGRHGHGGHGRGPDPVRHVRVSLPRRPAPGRRTRRRARRAARGARRLRRPARSLRRNGPGPGRRVRRDGRHGIHGCRRIRRDGAAEAPPGVYHPERGFPRASRRAGPGRRGRAACNCNPPSRDPRSATPGRSRKAPARVESSTSTVRWAAARRTSSAAPRAGVQRARVGYRRRTASGSSGSWASFACPIPDLTTLALGTDLTTLGLNLNSPEPLYKTFGSPWADTPPRPEVELLLPACYSVPVAGASAAVFQKFQQETLFLRVLLNPRRRIAAVRGGRALRPRLGFP